MGEKKTKEEVVVVEAAVVVGHLRAAEVGHARQMEEAVAVASGEQIHPHLACLYPSRRSPDNHGPARGDCGLLCCAEVAYYRKAAVRSVPELRDDSQNLVAVLAWHYLSWLSDVKPGGGFAILLVQRCKKLHLFSSSLHSPWVHKKHVKSLVIPSS